MGTCSQTQQFQPQSPPSNRKTPLLAEKATNVQTKPGQAGKTLGWRMWGRQEGTLGRFWQSIVERYREASDTWQTYGKTGNPMVRFTF